jgi:hypothetical protein
MTVKKRGRPVKVSSRRHDFKVRLNDDELDMLEFIAWKTDSNKAKVVRKALKMYFEIVKAQY